MNLTTKKNWRTTTLNQVIELIGGGTPKTTVEEYWNGDIPWLSVVDFNNDSRWVFDAEKMITKLGLENSSTKLLQEKDIIISARGTVGALAQVSKPMAFNQSCYGIRAKEGNDQDFLYYLLKYSVPKVIKTVHGAVFDTITRDSFSNVDIIIPESIDEQREIAGVLGCLDDKIELLRKENKTLEEIAQTLFKEWFVNFNFPSATGRMIDSELGEIPEGWRVGKLGEVGDIVCGKTPSKSEQKYFDGEVPFIKIPDMHNQMYIFTTEDSLTEAGADSQKNKYIPEDSLCVSCIATVGLVSITTESSQTNQQINSIVPSSKNILEYLYFVVSSKREDLQMIGGGGSATLNVNTGVFSNLEIVLPKNGILDLFHEASSQLFQKIKTNSKEIKTLSKLRDGLLDKIFK